MSFSVRSNIYNFRKDLMEPDHILIDQWYGRFGNNVIQVINALHIALGMKKNLIISNPHPLLKSLDLFINPEQRFFIKPFKDFSGFFEQQERFSNHYKENVEIVKNKVSKLLNINIENLVYDSDENLVIHIRGGDILNKHHKNYKPLPFLFYEKVISSKDWKKIKLVCEDQNYITDYLTKKYPQIEFKINTLEEDIKTILSSKNIIMSIGTFIPALLIFSKNVKNVYKVKDNNFQNLEVYTDHNYICIEACSS